MRQFLPSPRLGLSVLTGINVLNYLDRYVAAAVLPLLLTGLALSDTQGGALQTMVIVVYTFVSPLAGWIAPLTSRFRLAAIGAVIWSAATFASGLTTTFTLLLVARALVGFGEATYAVVAPTLLSDFYPSANRGRVLAIFYCAIPVGSALGFQLGGWAGSNYGYQSAFFIGGVPGLLLGGLLFFMRDPERGAMDSHLRQRTLSMSRSVWRALWQRKAFVYNTVSQTLYTFSLGGLAYWMPTFYSREHGLSLKFATFVFGAILVVAGFIGTLVGGYWGDRMSRRHSDAHFTFSGWTLLASLPFSVLAIAAPQPAVYWGSLFVTLFLLFINTGPLNAAMVNALEPELREKAYGVHTFAIHALGDAISPILIGLASDRIGLKWPMILVSAYMSLGGVVLLLGRSALRRDLQVLSSDHP